MKMNIFTRFYNWLLGIKPEPLTPRQKMRRAMQRAINCIKDTAHCGLRGNNESDTFAKRGPAYNPPMDQNGVNDHLKENWQNRMDSEEKKLSRGSQNIFSIIKGRCNWGNKNLWRRCDKQKPSTTKYGKPHRGHDN